MSDHTVRAYDQELETLGQKIAEMGGVAEPWGLGRRFRRSAAIFGPKWFT